MRMLLDSAKKQVTHNPVGVGIIVLLIIVVLYFLWGAIKKALSYLSSSIKAVGSRLSKDEAQAISSAIYKEVDKFQTDEDVIKDYIISLSLADYHKVKAEFGLQPYLATLDEFNIALGTDLNLTEILNITLHDEQKKELNNKAPHLPIR